MQGAFDFYQKCPARPKRPERLFFGLFPDTETSLQIERLRQKFFRDHSIEAACLSTERLDVSLHHIGDYGCLRPSLISAAILAGNAISIRRFDMTFHLAASFEGAPRRDGRPPRYPQVLLGAGDGLLELHKTLGDAMRRYGLKAANHLTPHMTLSYGRQSIPVQPIEPVRMMINDVSLIHSRLWLTQYQLVGRWPLRAS